MKVVIAHLYYDLMNLYGESGNVKALKRFFEDQGINVTIKFLSLDDKLDFKNYDIVYIGSGTEDNQKLVLNDLKKYTKELKNYIAKNKVLLATGNAFEIFGNSIRTKNGTFTGLQLFDYNTTEIADFLKAECLFTTDLIEEAVIGFQNRRTLTHNIEGENSLFKVNIGIGNTENSKYEGYHDHNFFGTYLIGPLLVRNPAFTKYLIETIISNKQPKFKLRNINYDLEEKAYQNYIEMLTKN